jgi:plastocyanin
LGRIAGSGAATSLYGAVGVRSKALVQHDPSYRTEHTVKHGRCISLLLVLAATAMLIASCGGSDDNGGGKSTAAGGDAVKISDFKFAPATITVKHGTGLSVTNSDSTAHTATADDGHTFDTGTIDPGASKTISVPSPGPIRTTAASIPSCTERSSSTDDL